MILSEGIKGVRVFELPAGVSWDGNSIQSGFAIIKWESMYINKLYQVYVNGKFGGLTKESGQRQINELLNVLNDEETGVEFITTGKTPYYLEFRKLLHRLILATKKTNDLRVFDEGGLSIGVKGGRFQAGSSIIEYAGSSGNMLADDKSSIFVYLNASGDLILNEYTQFPNLATTSHLRLAVITTSNGDITSIEDVRCNFFVPGV